MNLLGKLDYIIDLETVLGYWLTKIKFNTNLRYAWGDELYLTEWIRNEDSKMQFNGRVYDIGNNTASSVTKSKYPLVWLVSPVTGEAHDGKSVIFRDVSILFACNTNQHDLNVKRWQNNIPKLQQLADDFISQSNGLVSIEKRKSVKQFEYINYPKYVVKDKNTPLDWWDVVKIKTNLIASNKCINKDYYNFCNN